MSILSILRKRHEEPASGVHFHAGTGLAGYGIQCEAEDVATFATAVEMADYLSGECKRASEFCYESAHVQADSYDYEAAWHEIERSEALDVLAANLDSTRRAEAPLYVENPALLERAMLALITEHTPIETSEYGRIYVWDCTESDCEWTFEEE